MKCNWPGKLYQSPIILIASLACTLLLSAESHSPITGDYIGALGPLSLKLHIKASADGDLTCTLDSPSQGANGLPCADFHRDVDALSFTIPAVQGSWKGTVGADGNTLTGTWTQGSPMPLNFSRDTFMPASKPSPVDGFWLGTLHAGAASLRIQITVRSDAAGNESCTLDSLDQHAFGIPCANVTFAPPHLRFEVPAVKGNWSGDLSEDGKKLIGTWTQGPPMPLELERQTSAQTAAAIRYDPGQPPVPIADLDRVLRDDLQRSHAFDTGFLAPSSGIGISIGVLDHGERRLLSYGSAKPDSIFEIGSITKTFTGLILAQMVEQGQVQFAEPVRSLLPPGTATKPSGQEITLLDLATQHSGLPRMPDNFHPADPNNPYADYRAADLYAFVAKHGVERPAHPEFLYSNLGFGLLGQALADRTGVAYPQLLRQEVLDPLGMCDTTVVLSPAQQARLLEGHSDLGKPAHVWDLDAMAGVGAIRATAGDMLTYLAAQLHPAAALTSKPGSTSTLPAAILATHELHDDGPPGTRIALAWMYVPQEDLYFHDGGTGGYNSFVLFSPKADRAVVVLVNITVGLPVGSAHAIAQHVLARLDGKPAVSLEP